MSKKVSSKSLKNYKIAIFHHFFKADCKGGGEKLILQMRHHYQADLWVGGVDFSAWGKHLKDTDDFARRVWEPGLKFDYLHQESRIPGWRQIKRQLFFLLSPKIKKLENYDLIIFSYGNIGFVPNRISKQVKKVMYCHTPPRPFTDQFAKRLENLHPFLRPLAKILKNWVLARYRKDSAAMDLILTNSQNITNRLEKFVDIKADKHIFPAVDTDRFKWKGQGDYFISYGRLEKLKRIDIIIDAFAKMPDKKLVICSGGPLTEWVKEQIQSRDLRNIDFKGRVDNEELTELVGNCLAGIYIPEDEDAGITQCEIMSAGKPVIGVKEGGLLETVIDGQTGLLIPANPTTQDLIYAINKMTPELALSMKENSIKQASQFSEKIFFNKLDEVILEILES